MLQINFFLILQKIRSNKVNNMSVGGYLGNFNIFTVFQN